MVKNVLANAGNMSSIPGPRRFHMPCHNYWNLLQWETHTLQLEGSPCLPQLEKVYAQPQMNEIKRTDFSLTIPCKPRFPVPSSFGLLLIGSKLIHYPLGIGIGSRIQVYSEQWFSGPYIPTEEVKMPLTYRAALSYSFFDHTMRHVAS